MADNKQHSHHHSHHHHHSHDYASTFKNRSLLEIERQKYIAKWLFRILCVVAALMVIAVFVVYHLN